MDDSPPEYSTIVTIQKEEESPPTYIEALEKQKVCQWLIFNYCFSVNKTKDEDTYSGLIRIEN